MNQTCGRLILYFATVACAREPAEIIHEVPAARGGSGGAGSTEPGGSAGFPHRTSAVLGVAGTDSRIPKLTEESHPGFRQAVCSDCHGTIAVYPHASSNYRSPDCVGCHGDNGAPHRDHAVIENAGCPSCHATVAHIQKFVAPSDCVKCHQPPK